MSKKQKKSKRGIERKEKRQQFRLSEELTKLERTTKIPLQEAIKPEIPDYDERMRENHLFSFALYNPKECELCKLDPISAKGLMRKLKQLNETKISELPSSHLIRGKVKNVEHYKALYNGLSPDVEIEEIEFSGTGRVFAYFVGRYVCVIAIKVKHINYKR